MHNVQNYEVEKCCDEEVLLKIPLTIHENLELAALKIHFPSFSIQILLFPVHYCVKSLVFFI